MIKPRDFLAEDEKAQVEEAIRQAECKTSGEICVHIESHSDDEVKSAAVDVFFALRMEQTKHHNGVLFYILCNDRRFAVIGDKGIDDLVPMGFWDDVCELLSRHFANDERAKGLIEAITLCGNKLSEFFPPDAEAGDELPNDISFGR